MNGKSAEEAVIEIQTGEEEIVVVSEESIEVVVISPFYILQVDSIRVWILQGTCLRGRKDFSRLHGAAIRDLLQMKASVSPASATVGVDAAHDGHGFRTVRFRPK